MDVSLLALVYFTATLTIWLVTRALLGLDSIPLPTSWAFQSVRFVAYIVNLKEDILRRVGPVGQRLLELYDGLKGSMR